MRKNVLVSLVSLSLMMVSVHAEAQSRTSKRSTNVQTSRVSQSPTASSNFGGLFDLGSLFGSGQTQAPQLPAGTSDLSGLLGGLDLGNLDLEELAGSLDLAAIQAEAQKCVEALVPDTAKIQQQASQCVEDLDLSNAQNLTEADIKAIVAKCTADIVPDTSAIADGAKACAQDILEQVNLEDFVK